MHTHTGTCQQHALILCCAHQEGDAAQLDVGAGGDVGAAVLAGGGEGGAEESKLLGVDPAVGDRGRGRGWGWGGELGAVGTTWVWWWLVVATTLADGSCGGSRT